VSANCEPCDKPFGMSRKPVKTVLGRTVCTDCSNTTIGVAAGMLGAQATGVDPVPTAIASEGFLRRLLSRKKS
jgi:hypothetical protein